MRALSAQDAHIADLVHTVALDSGCQWLLGVVGRPAHGRRADVVETAASARPQFFGHNFYVEIFLSNFELCINIVIVFANWYASCNIWSL